jgi:hypothetical protein
MHWGTKKERRGQGRDGYRGEMKWRMHCRPNTFCLLLPFTKCHWPNSMSYHVHIHWTCGPVIIVPWRMPSFSIFLAAVDRSPHTWTFECPWAITIIVVYTTIFAIEFHCIFTIWPRRLSSCLYNFVGKRLRVEIRWLLASICPFADVGGYKRPKLAMCYRKCTTYFRAPKDGDGSTGCWRRRRWWW